jgi:hypothetical protein
MFQYVRLARVGVFKIFHYTHCCYFSRILLPYNNTKNATCATLYHPTDGGWLAGGHWFVKNWFVKNKINLKKIIIIIIKK